MANLYFDNSNNVYNPGDPLTFLYGGTADDDVMYGYGGYDNLRGNLGNDRIFGGSGNDFLYGDQGNDSVYGEAGNDYLFGNAGNDMLKGGSGIDYLWGGTGTDTLIGGKGDDLYEITDSSDTIIESNSKSGGIDTVNAHVNYTLPNGVESLFLVGDAYWGGGNSGNNNIWGYEPTLKYSLNGGGGSDNILGNMLDDYLVGGSGHDNLNGGDGNDTLKGGVGNDILNGGSGADNMYGAAGNDTYYVDNINDRIDELFHDGFSLQDYGGKDEIISSINIDLGSESDHISDTVENLTFTGTDNLEGYGNRYNNILTGNQGNNVLDGRDGNDTLKGGVGNDHLYGTYGNNKMYGGIGSDQYYVYSKGDKAIEYKDEGTGDRVESHINYTLPANVENLILNSDASVGKGNILDNVITVAEAHNYTLYGYGGDDFLEGSIGNDFLDGGSGIDIMIGMHGDDIYIVDNSSDNPSEIGGSGTDTVKSSATFTLGYNIERLILTGNKAIDGTGNAGHNNMYGNTKKNVLEGLDGVDNLYGKGGNDTLLGGAGNDSLDGGPGTDWMEGGSGDDKYVVNSTSDTVSEDNGSGGDAGGNDVVQSTASFTLPDYVESLNLLGSSKINGTGNNLDNIIIGNKNNNIINGLDGKDYLSGADGEDILRGGDGWDELYGGQGNDRLFGGAGSDLMQGGSGNDKLYGGLGKDIYYVDSIKDIVIEEVDENPFTSEGPSTQWGDRIVSYVSYTLPQYVEQLYLYDGAGASILNINGTGNEGDNYISGTAGDNILKGCSDADFFAGLGGEDVLRGGLGDDTYWVNSPGDFIDENIDRRQANGEPVYPVAWESGGGNDTVITTLTSYTLAPDFENLTLLTPNSSGTGNAADNLLSAQDGSILNGGAGNDVYSIYGTVTVVEGIFAGTDSVKSWSEAYALPMNVENLFLKGKVKYGTGNQMDNQIFGNAQNNSISGVGGDDLIDGGKGIDTMYGGDGNDTYWVDSSYDKVIEYGGTVGGLDTVYSSKSFTLKDSVEQLYLTGLKQINGTGNDSANEIYGNSKTNKLSGRGGVDRLYGHGGNDTLVGGDGSDFLSGGIGNDKLQGGAGNDGLFGEAGNDTLTGGAGNDNFYFSTPLDAAHNKDTIVDFTTGEDSIILMSDIFPELFAAEGGSGPLEAGHFYSSSTKAVAAQDSNDFILYSTTSGALYYDADGNLGGSDPIRFATLTGSPNDLEANDFQILA